MIKARASGSKVYLYFMKKGRQARHRIPRNSCFKRERCMYMYLRSREAALHYNFLPQESAVNGKQFIFRGANSSL